MYYEALGASRSSSADELKRAYRRAVKASHPDTGGDAAAFQRVQDAWAVLGDPVRRKAYDVRGTAAGGAEPRPATAAASSTSARPVPPTAAEATPGAAEAPGGPESGGAGSWGWRVGFAIAAAGLSGAAGVWVGFSAFGVAGAIAAGLYLVLVAAALVERSHGAGEWGLLLSRLLAASWALTVLWVVVSGLRVAIGWEWWPTAVFAAIYGAFGVSVTYLGHRAWED